MPLRFLFIDFNAFFASVEQQENPKLRGKPIVVVPVMAENTACIAASYEAKKFKIKTGTSPKEAKKLCPDVIVIEAQPPLYIKYHNQLVEAVDSCIPIYAVKSIDEMACELSGSQKKKENAIELARQIKQTISKNVGDHMRCSIGIAPNIFLAKTATDMQKPNGLVVIEEKDLPKILYSFELEELSGVGRNMKTRLYRHGIYTVEQLCNAKRDQLKKAWGGIEGERMYDRLRGSEPILPPTHHTTVGHSHVLSPEERNDKSAIPVLHRMLQKASMRLRKMKLQSRSISVSIQYYDNKRWGDVISFTETSDTLQLTQALTTLLRRKPKIDETPLRVSITLLNLVSEETHTPSIFEDERKSSALFSAIDELNLRYGKSALYFGGAHTALESSPPRIAFNHIPDLSIEEGKGGYGKTRKKKPEVEQDEFGEESEM